MAGELMAGAIEPVTPVKGAHFVGLFGNPFAYRADTGSHKDLVCRSVCRNGLIAVDKVGYVPLAEVGADFLFQVIPDGPKRLW